MCIHANICVRRREGASPSAEARRVDAQRSEAGGRSDAPAGSSNAPRSDAPAGDFEVAADEDLWGNTGRLGVYCANFGDVRRADFKAVMVENLCNAPAHIIIGQEMCCLCRPMRLTTGLFSVPKSALTPPTKLLSFHMQVLITTP